MEAPFGFKKVSDKAQLNTGDEIAIWNPGENNYTFLVYKKDESNTNAPLQREELKGYSRNKQIEKRIFESIEHGIAAGQVYKKSVQRR